MKNGSGAKTLVIVLTSALLLVGLLVLAYVVLLRGNRQPQIVLPTDQTHREDPVDPSQPKPDRIVALNPDNVLDALRTLTPEDYYHETLGVSIIWDEGSSSRRVERYCAQGVQRISVTGQNGTRCYLSDGQTLYVWYDGDETAVSRPLDGAVSLMDLAGLPDYLEELQHAQIQEVSFLSEDDIQEERDTAIFMNWVLMSKCAELWVFGSNISKGMKAEIDRAKRKHMKIRYFTEELEETT